jgi:hypothetical protein
MEEEAKNMTEQTPRRRRSRQPKYDSSYVQAGRPPKKPLNKLKESMRFMCTTKVKRQLTETGKGKYGLNPSDMLRLAVYRFLEGEGLMDEEMRADATWETLVNQGLASAPDLFKVENEPGD